MRASTVTLCMAGIALSVMIPTQYMFVSLFQKKQSVYRRDIIQGDSNFEKSQNKTVGIMAQFAELPRSTPAFSNPCGKLSCVHINKGILVSSHPVDSNLSSVGTSTEAKRRKAQLNQHFFINIVLACDYNGLGYLITVIQSVVSTSKQRERLHFVIVLVHVPREPFAGVMQHCFPHLSHRIIVWDPPDYLKNITIRDSSRSDLSNVANYARFHVAELAPDLEKVLYLDNDILLLSPVEDLFNTDLGGFTAAMVGRYCGSQQFYSSIFGKTPHFNKTHPIVQDVILTKKKHCLPNAGVLLMNLTIWRDVKGPHHVEMLIERNRKENIFSLGSQPPLMLVLRNTFLVLDPRWNADPHWNTGTVQVQPGLIHWRGTEKPWAVTDKLKKRDLQITCFFVQVFPSVKTHAIAIGLVP
mmetsp:Transcript_27646/g.43145  ORF Transcript_27646/g.43145 Transcript_27646/m.43145 type:complete len:412 (-) Transcript_27646:606-1841(-)